MIRAIKMLIGVLCLAPMTLIAQPAINATTLPVTLFDVQAVSCSSPSSCMAVGYYTVGGVYTYPLSGKFALGRWWVEKVSVPKNAFAANLAQVSCRSASMCIAVGSIEAGNTSPRTLVESWNGKSWTAMTSGSV